MSGDFFIQKTRKPYGDKTILELVEAGWTVCCDECKPSLGPSESWQFNSQLDKIWCPSHGWAKVLLRNPDGRPLSQLWT